MVAGGIEDPVHIYFFLPTTATGKEVKITYNGIEYSGILTVLPNHGNNLILRANQDGPIEPPPKPPKPAGPIYGEPLVFQIGANGTADQRVSLSIPCMDSSHIGDPPVNTSSIATRALANEAIASIDSAINYVSGVRADLGSMQNRLEHTLKNLGVSKENLQSAESTIRDVDMAKEMMEFTKNNILMQASQSMLAQANQLPSGVLQLLQ
jgi:flagellin-like hook-associated protein FlgL